MKTMAEEVKAAHRGVLKNMETNDLAKLLLTYAMNSRLAGEDDWFVELIQEELKTRKDV